MRISPHPGSAVRVCQGDDTGIRDARALDKSNPLQLWKGGKSSHRVIRQVGAAAEVNVAYPVAHRDQPLDAIVCDVAAMAQVKKV
jgi:hypothetical protein